MGHRELSYSDLDSVASPSGAAPSTDDALFIARLRANENTAYDELVRTHHASIYHVAYRMLRDPGEAADVTQDVFVKVFRHIDGFRGESSLRTWLFKIAFSEILNRVRWSRRRYLHRTVSIEEETQKAFEGHASLQLADQRATPEVELERKEREEAFQNALWKLSEEHRSVAVLRDIQGFSYAEIADILGISMGTVKSRLARARSELKRHLMPYLSVHSFGGQD
jgi:RNA polymerase sigma-70 factor (ECF subfamily)